MLEKLSETLFNLRREKGSTQKEVALYAGVTPAALSAYEKGTKTPQLETAVKLAEYYGVSLDLLCGIEKDTDVKEDRAFTRADAVRLISILRAKMPYITLSYDSGLDGDFRPYNNAVITINTLEETWIQDYFEKFDTLMRLHASKDIDFEVVSAWKEKKLKEYEQFNLEDESPF